jgi:hypothetical protein
MNNFKRNCPRTETCSIITTITIIIIIIIIIIYCRCTETNEEIYWQNEVLSTWIRCIRQKCNVTKEKCVGNNFKFVGIIVRNMGKNIKLQILKISVTAILNVTKLP